MSMGSYVAKLIIIELTNTALIVTLRALPTDFIVEILSEPKFNIIYKGLKCNTYHLFKFVEEEIFSLCIHKLLAFGTISR